MNNQTKDSVIQENNNAYNEYLLNIFQVSSSKKVV